MSNIAKIEHSDRGRCRTSRIKGKEEEIVQLGDLFFRTQRGGLGSFLDAMP